MANTALNLHSESNFSADETKAVLVNRIGQLNKQKSELESVIKQLRLELELLIGDPGDGLLIETAEFDAISEYPTERGVHARNLYDLNQSAFWALAKIPVTEAEDLLQPELFHQVLMVKKADAPKLTIRKKKHALGNSKASRK